VKTCNTCGVVKDESEFHVHKGSKDGLRYICKACAKIKSKEYYQNNKENVVIKTKQYKQNNKEKISTQKKNYRQDNKKQIATYKKEYYGNNKEVILERIKKYNQTSAGKTASLRSRHKRRAQKLNAEYEKFSHLEIFERDNWRCQKCHKKVRSDKNPCHDRFPNIDHIISLSNGGSHTRKNTQLLCRQCNMIKNNKDSNQQLRLFGV